MTTEQERAAFEAWYQHHHGDRDVYVLDESGEYADKQVQGAFNVWQAAIAHGRQDHLRTAAEMMPSDEEILALAESARVWVPMGSGPEKERSLQALRSLIMTALSRYSSGQPSASAEHQQLREFYDVLTDDELIDAQQHHIEKLQARLPGRAPFPVRVREG